MSAIYGVKSVSVKLPDPSVVPTPFSKKQPPPNDRPTVVTLPAAAMKSAALLAEGCPFQSLHWPVGSPILETNGSVLCLGATDFLHGREAQPSRIRDL